MMRLYLDDIRDTPAGFDLRAYTASECIGMLMVHNVSFISFDHDLGPEEAGTGYEVARWIEEQAHTNPEYRVPNYRVHSANPVGARNIHLAMQSAWHRCYGDYSW